MFSLIKQSNIWSSTLATAPLKAHPLFCANGWKCFAFRNAAFPDWFACTVGSLCLRLSLSPSLSTLSLSRLLSLFLWLSPSVSLLLTGRQNPISVFLFLRLFCPCHSQSSSVFLFSLTVIPYLFLAISVSVSVSLLASMSVCQHFAFTLWLEVLWRKLMQNVKLFGKMYWQNLLHSTV